MKRLRQKLGAIWLLVFGLFVVLGAWNYSTDLWKHLHKPIDTSAQSLGILILFQLAFWGVLTLSWKQVLSATGINRTPIFTCFWHQMLLLLGKYIPGKVWGMLVRGNQMMRAESQLANVAAATYLEQILSIHSGAIIASLLMPALFPELWATAIVAAAILSIPVGAHLCSASVRLMHYIARKFGQTAQPSVIHVSIRRYAALLIGYGTLWVISGSVLLTLAVVFLDQHLTPMLAATLLLANVAGIMAGFLALFAPGGIGVREGVMVGMMLSVLPLDQAVELALVSRLWQVATDLAGGVLGYWLGRNGNYASRPLP